MFDRIVRLNKWQILSIYVIIGIVIRLPFFFRDYIDHDESTFIIMGQTIVDGHLPYTTYWDLKPPLVFYTFAGIISIFGKSFIAIRLFGSIVVGLSAWFTYRLSYIHFNRLFSFFAGLLTIYLFSLFGAMQGVMSEHLATLPLLMGLFYLSKYNSTQNFVWCGFLFGIAIMYRLNLAYAIFFVYAYILFDKGLNFRSIIKGLLLTLGSFLSFAICHLPYIKSGKLLLLKKSVYEASLAYSDVGLNKMLEILPLLIGILLLCGFAMTYLKSKKNQKTLMLIIVILVGQAFMFFKGGKINGHYLIQIYPFLAILIVAFIAKIHLSNRIVVFVPTALLLLFVLLPIESYIETVRVFQSYKTTGSLANGEGNIIPKYLTQKYGSTSAQKILCLNEHIAYWVLNTTPPTAISTHPSNISRIKAYEYVENTRMSPKDEMKYIMEQKTPNFVLFDTQRIPMPRESEEYIYLIGQLKSQYTLDTIFGNSQSVKVYRIKGL